MIVDIRFTEDAGMFANQCVQVKLIRKITIVPDGNVVMIPYITHPDNKNGVIDIPITNIRDLTITEN